MTIQSADVKDFRKRRSMSRKQLAAITGLTEGKIWRIEEKGNISAAEDALLTSVGVLAVTWPEPTLTVGPTPLPIAPAVVFVEPVIVTDAPEIDFPKLIQRAERTYERYVSNSEIQTFKRCRRKWWLAWHRGLRAKSESPVGVRQIGNRLHRALQAHYVPGGPPSPQHLLDELERLVTLDRSQADAWGYFANEELALQFEKEADLERIMMEGYLEWLAQTGADAELQVIAPEAYLEVGLEEFGDHVLAIIGKIDVRLRRTTDGVILFLDHKSVAEFTTTTKLLPIAEQMIHYQLLETLSAEEGQHVEGALYNMMRRVKRTATARPPFYQRVEVRHNPIVLQNYRNRLVGEITQVLNVGDHLSEHPELHQAFAYPSPTRDCSWDCDFFQVCPMFDDGSRAEDMLRDRFIEGDPLEYYMTEVIGMEEQR